MVGGVGNVGNASEDVRSKSMGYDNFRTVFEALKISHFGTPEGAHLCHKRQKK